MDMRRLVGLNFARLRKDKGFTQERFAETSGFTQQYVSDMERGRRNPTVVTLFHLASALGVTPADLVAEVDPSETD
ncbi:helix-turn-helix domain-containing protein [Nitrobacter winogradskyi]|uniref:Transcriptional regulator with XRE-family HTH domain n=2 Tax=Nitrobacter winogradskyi TaxID=913 RepID=A0ACC6AJG3_NITWI|nr:helix-turn-helix transcriptional regulator [Nitrobacter winogradskyi]MCP1999898.1 transcriptional regulator with XRE-family HTH domain [Nitrobacter winogradskyi]GEC16331.1 putative HTH-type transcriptional regulator y4dJ [Nitrobacter winogradskyi]